MDHDRRDDKRRDSGKKIIFLSFFLYFPFV